MSGNIDPKFETQTSQGQAFCLSQEEVFLPRAMNQIAIREVAVTAKEEGRVEGRMEGRVEGLEQKEAELVLKPYKNGKTTAEISSFLDIPEARVEQIIQDYERKQRLNS